MKWYFQLTPNDGWDYDENGINFVFDGPIDGVMTDWCAPPSGPSVTPLGVPTRIDCPPA